MLSFFKNILSCLTFLPLFQRPRRSKPLEFQDGIAQDFEAINKDINHAFKEYHEQNKHLLSPENKDKVDKYLSNF
jgi:hypothetical protein